MVSVSDPIIVVGVGAGLSVALHLALRGYTNVSVFAKDVYRAAQDAGVKIFLGQQVDQIAYVSTLTGKKNAGIRTRNGFHPSSLVIIEAGARDNASEIGQLHGPNSLAIPLSSYTNTNSKSLVEYVPQTSSSVILLSRNSVQTSQISLVGPMVLDLLAATSGQQSENSSQPLSKL
ncbi:hypothetical protein N7517_008508 [Penicillium concentricum]|uniref:Uncharacterized protein n=1 Tax=Penicillium concentricum TaxID=293559 RepID=A0A9W9V1R1_9EURO|nr:uncharacterized protein N7517_008508 [Penicillium concentricum]KAJ5365622.1 hypothetical protein N7517_008508 [Penicillium concentricum]